MQGTPWFGDRSPRPALLDASPRGAPGDHGRGTTGRDPLRPGSPHAPRLPLHNRVNHTPDPLECAVGPWTRVQPAQLHLVAGAGCLTRRRARPSSLRVASDVGPAPRLHHVAVPGGNDKWRLPRRTGRPCSRSCRVECPPRPRRSTLGARNPNHRLHGKRFRYDAHPEMRCEGRYQFGWRDRAPHEAASAAVRAPSAVRFHNPKSHGEKERAPRGDPAGGSRRLFAGLPGRAQPLPTPDPSPLLTAKGL